MRILLSTPYLNRAGTEIHMLNLARGLMDAGHDVLLMAPDGPMKADFESAGVKVVEFISLNQNGLLGAKDYVAKLREIMRAASLDVIHVHAGSELVLLSWWAKRNVCRNIPIIFTVHSFFGSGMTASYKFAGMMGNRIAEKVIAVSDRDSLYLSDAGLKKEKCRVIHNCIAPPAAIEEDRIQSCRRELGLDRDTICICNIGRLEPQKGQDVLVDAAALLDDRGALENLRLVIVGSGSMKDKLSERVKSLGIEEKVIFLGNRQDALNILQASDIFVLPSRMEGFSLALLEAGAVGRPIIATDVGGNSEFVSDGQTGILIKSEDHRELADAIERLVRDPNLRTKLGTSVRDLFYERFTLEHMVEETIAVYDSASSLKSKS